MSSMPSLANLGIQDAKGNVAPMEVWKKVVTFYRDMVQYVPDPDLEEIDIVEFASNSMIFEMARNFFPRAEDALVVIHHMVIHRPATEERVEFLERISTQPQEALKVVANVMKSRRIHE